MPSNGGYEIPAMMLYARERIVSDGREGGGDYCQHCVYLKMESTRRWTLRVPVYQVLPMKAIGEGKKATIIYYKASETMPEK